MPPARDQPGGIHFLWGLKNQSWCCSCWWGFNFGSASRFCWTVSVSKSVCQCWFCELQLQTQPMGLRKEAVGRYLQLCIKKRIWQQKCTKQC